ncbi:10841_t:CDS:2 [Paraglomus occultum]|uniref:glucose-6-phosphate 1-epimerase n=1 Tax=Paraglomus occultum TaxID=144539 RepID=A0A9N8VDS2_9GLOM|nr:10841_t:CDS:2 [Paraglomus occultum]
MDSRWKREALSEVLTELLLPTAFRIVFTFINVELTYHTSKNAILNGTKAIRGGIPLVFPQFGKAEDSSAPTAALPQHGFARNSKWEFLEGKDDDNEVTGIFTLSPSSVPSELYQKWPFPFKLLYTVILRPQSLSTFISDISKLKIHNLTNNVFTDKVANGARDTETREVITVNGEVDRVYEDVITEDVLVYCGDESGIRIKRVGVNDVVVWNPWLAKAAAMSDFGDDEYKEMICVELGNVSKYVRLAPGETWEGGQELSVI